MENKNIIIILIVIIVVLAAAIGVILLNPTNAKEPTRLIITNDDEQNEGGELSIKLTDLNKTPISKEIVNIRITDGNGNVVVDDVVKTNSKGKANLDLDLDEGEYIVNVSYGGNENYTGNNATQKLTIKEEVVEAQVTSSNSNAESSSQSYDWVDSEGFNHYYENGQEYVGSRNGQHMDIDTHNYVKEHGMGD